MIVGLLLIVWMLLIVYVTWDAWLDAKHERDDFWREYWEDRQVDIERERRRGLWDD